MFDVLAQPYLTVQLAHVVEVHAGVAVDGVHVAPAALDDVAFVQGAAAASHEQPFHRAREHGGGVGAFEQGPCAQQLGRWRADLGQRLELVAVAL